MKVSRKYLILLLVAACVAVIWAVIPYCLDSLRDADSIVPSRRSDKLKEEVASVDTQGYKYPRDFIYPIGNTRDPFEQISFLTDTSTQAASPRRKPIITLTGIIWDEENPIAIVADSKNNSYLLTSGEEINGTMIVAIHSGYITIQSEEEAQELVLWPETSYGQSHDSGVISTIR